MPSREKAPILSIPPGILPGIFLLPGGGFRHCAHGDGLFSLFASSRYITRMVLYSSTSILVIALVLLVVFPGKVIEPVNRLRDAVAVLSQDPISAAPLPVRRNDEIGELTREYNNMAAIIREQLREITMEKARWKRPSPTASISTITSRTNSKPRSPSSLGYAEMIEETGFSDLEFGKRHRAYHQRKQAAAGYGHRPIRCDARGRHGYFGF